jgi:hypothetical protein
MAKKMIEGIDILMDNNRIGNGSRGNITRKRDRITNNRYQNSCWKTNGLEIHQ